MYIFINGDIVEQNKVNISPFDHGFMYGLGLFETFRVDDGHPFLIADHLNRLHDGLEQFNIEWNFDKKDILNFLDQLLQANGLSHAYIRLNVSAGIGDIGLQTKRYTKPNTIIFIKPLPEGAYREKNGVFLKTKRNSPEGPIRLKSHHYFNNILAKREIGDDLSKEGIFTTESGYIAEGIVSNIFWVKDHKVYTPCLETGILNGITRKFVIELLKNRKMDYEMGFYTQKDLLQCDEAFITNSIQEVVPLKSIDGHPLNSQNRQVTDMLVKDYRFYKNKHLQTKNDVYFYRLERN